MTRVRGAGGVTVTGGEPKMWGVTVMGERV